MRAALALAVTIFLASLAVGAQGGGSGAQQQPTPPATPAQPPAQPPAAPAPPPGTPTKALVPIAASTLAANPEAYVGEFVSLTGTVEQSIGKMAFSVDQDAKKSTGKDIVVLMRHLSGTIDPQTYVTVIGQVVKYDAAEFASTFKEWADALPRDAAGSYAGKPVIIATSVINVAGIDVMRRLPPPMTAEEEAFQKIMKQVGSSNAALRKGMEASDVKLAAENAVLLRQSFTEAEAFWKRRSRNDAVTWAQDAKKLSDTIHRAAAAGKWDEVKTSATTLGQTCQSCHAAHRERFDDGSYRIKKPTTAK
jgi:cytochrome c556